MHKLFGLLVPYGVRTATPVSGSQFREQVEIGSFDQEALSGGPACRFRVNHDRGQQVEDAQISFTSLHSGLYVTLHLPRSAQTKAIMRERSSWRGLSIGMMDVDADVEWNSCTRVVTRVGFISTISLCIGLSPAYRETWLDDAGPESTARARRENEQRLAETWGADYRTKYPASWYALPLQSRVVEAALCASDPGREYEVVMPWGCGTMVRSPVVIR